MQLTLRRLALASVLPLLMAAPSQADDTPPGLKIELANSAEGKGSFYRISAKTQPLPDGARLTVSISARGKTRDYLCKIMKVVVANNRFLVQDAWPKRKLAPLLYIVKVGLDLRKQSPDIRRWLQTEYGHSPSHSEYLEEVEHKLGTDEELAAFSLKNLTAIEGLATRLQELLETVKTLTATPAAENPDYKAQHKAANNSFVAYRTAVDAHFKGHVILLEQGLCKRLRRGIAKISRLVRDFGRGRTRNVDRAINGFTSEFASNVDLVRSMMPVSEDEPLIPDEKNPGEK